MIDNPIIKNYKGFYIQQRNGNAIDVLSQYNLIAKTNPFVLSSAKKELYSNDWYDEDAKEEYITDNLEQLEFEVQFYVRGKDTSNTSGIGDVKASIKSFLNAINTDFLSVYDNATKLGRRMVRYDSYQTDELKFINDGQGSVYCIFTVKFKCNDPKTDMILSNNKIFCPYYGECYDSSETINKTVYWNTTPSGKTFCSIKFRYYPPTARSFTINGYDVDLNGYAVPANVWYIFLFADSKFTCYGTI